MSGRPRPESLDRNRAIVAAVRAGRPLQNVAAEHQISVPRVSKICADFGVSAARERGWRVPERTTSVAPKANTAPKARTPKANGDRSLGPADILPEHEVSEARRLRDKGRGWSIAGLCRRYEINEHLMRIVLGEPQP